MPSGGPRCPPRKDVLRSKAPPWDLDALRARRPEGKTSADKTRAGTAPRGHRVLGGALRPPGNMPAGSALHSPLRAMCRDTATSGPSRHRAVGCCWRLGRAQSACSPCQRFPRPLRRRDHCAGAVWLPFIGPSGIPHRKAAPVRCSSAGTRYSSSGLSGGVSRGLRIVPLISRAKSCRALFFISSYVNFLNSL